LTDEVPKSNQELSSAPPTTCIHANHKAVGQPAGYASVPEDYSTLRRGVYYFLYLRRTPGMCLKKEESRLTDCSSFREIFDFIGQRGSHCLRSLIQCFLLFSFFFFWHQEAQDAICSRREKYVSKRATITFGCILNGTYCFFWGTRNSFVLVPIASGDPYVKMFIHISVSTKLGQFAIPNLEARGEKLVGDGVNGPVSF
jgi:hypothetical protein